MYDCMNVVTEKEGMASAVLIRALEPIQNIHRKTNGPGLLCRAMGITRALNGYDLCRKDVRNFYIASSRGGSRTAPTIVSRPRIGVDYAGHWAKRLLRFYIKNNTYISKK
jgi:DNA-3-methyladenine glycosylase